MPINPRRFGKRRLADSLIKKTEEMTDYRITFAQREFFKKDYVSAEELAKLEERFKKYLQDMEEDVAALREEVLRRFDKRMKRK